MKLREWLEQVPTASPFVITEFDNMVMKVIEENGLKALVSESGESASTTYATRARYARRLTRNLSWRIIMGLCRTGESHTPDWTKTWTEADGRSHYLMVKCVDCEVEGFVAEVRDLEENLDWGE